MRNTNACNILYILYCTYVLVVPAGFGGIYQLYKLLQLGLSVKVIDKATDVGGTWYWNRYPGAMSDTESFVYRYSWDKEGLRTYPWSHHYVRQSEILGYLEHVVDKHNLRPHMQFNTELLSAQWDSTNETWRATLSTGETFIARYRVTALGLLSTAKFPDIPGVKSFKGQLCHTSAWQPDTQVANKRVGIIGNGSTGVQVITEISSQVKSLVSFQRHPQYSVPSGNRPVQPEYRQWVNENYNDIMENLRKSSTCFGVEEPTTPYSSLPSEEREEVFEKLWQQGNGFRFMFGGFSDLTKDPEANDHACRFIKNKIAQIVKDPEKARRLLPQDSYTRRPLCDGGYYKQFNRENVDIVNLQETPIEAIIPTGIRTSDGKEHELDMIIFATGFDAVEGSFDRLQFHGRSGQTLKERWSKGGKSYLGCLVPDLPNLFLITGPQGSFTNLPLAIEVHVELHSKLIKQAENVRARTGRATIEATAQVEQEWVSMCKDLADDSLLANPKSWLFNDTIKDEKPIIRFYLGGMKTYLTYVQKLVDEHAGLLPLGHQQLESKL
ncbi:cyclohexanone monooxygenase [Tothia fuscella]|uniref:Cyclohexanone monooxygenase n=1 Tax=Tothia fuscella TaxID=1048955 RepID=A0A9P4U078_9PEZI|nr:cyclohexanone monooxygenase [Tothia fuscella]